MNQLEKCHMMSHLDAVRAVRVCSCDYIMQLQFYTLKMIFNNGLTTQELQLSHVNNIKIER